MKPLVALIYDADCPNIEQARRALLQAFTKAGVAASWTEWDRQAPEAPARVRGYGSPTILIDDHDVAGAQPGETEACCRLYAHDGGGWRGVPAVDRIAAALTKEARSRAIWRAVPAALPGIGALLLPVGLCPACWPAYAGVLAFVGFGFLLRATYLFPITVALLLFALSTMAYNARTKHGFPRLILGAAGATVALAGKFVFGNMLVLWIGLALYASASLWSAWPPKAASCAACGQADGKSHETQTQN